MSTAMSKIMKIIDDDCISSRKRAAKRADDFEEELFFLACFCQATPSIRNEKSSRRRLDEPYLRDLPMREKSIVAKVVLNPDHPPEEKLQHSKTHETSGPYKT